MTVARAKGAKARADRLWSEVVRLGQVCISCRSPEGLHAHHIISRRYNRTRHLIENGWPLCASCHRRVHEDPVLFVELVDATIGRDRYRELRAMVVGPCHYREADWAQIALDLKEVRAEIQQHIDAGRYRPVAETQRYPRTKKPKGGKE